MATIAKPATRKRQLPTPPPMTETLGNLEEPESAPAPAPVSPAAGKIDGRTLRKTGRTEQFSTRVHPQFKKKIHALAKQTGKNYNVILEESLALFETQNSSHRAG